MGERINIGIIGYKFMGKAHSNAYRQAAVFYELPTVPVLKAICGRTMEGVSRAAKQYGWESCETSWKGLVARDDIDVVDISTPNSLHAEIAIEAAGRGKHVFCEKPMAVSLSEAVKMAKAVKKAGVLHMVGLNYRRFPALTFAKKLIEQGRIGTVYHFRAQYLQDWLVDPEFPLVWRLDRNVAGTGAIGDLGAHIIDMALYLVGDIAAVTADTETFVKNRPLEERTSPEGKGSVERGQVTVDDAFAAIARFKNGALGVFEASRFAAGRKNWGVFEINGSTGSMRFSLEKPNELEYLSAADSDEQGFKTILVTNSTHPFMSAWWPPGHMLGWEHSHIIQVYHLLDSIGKGVMPEPNFFDGVKNQAVLEAIALSSKDGRWHEVEQITV